MKTIFGFLRDCLFGMIGVMVALVFWFLCVMLEAPKTKQEKALFFLTWAAIGVALALSLMEKFAPHGTI